MPKRSRTPGKRQTTDPILVAARRHQSSDPILVAARGVPDLQGTGVPPRVVPGRLPDLFISTLALSETGVKLRRNLAERAFFHCRRIYLLGSRDSMFRSDQDISETVTRLYGSECIRESAKPRCYEVAAVSA